ncbi:hypothetical protein [Saccharopolyspora pogona]|uniref:hypothetical protein n=1 Tax=Saccharopolyspora pogona TaxID=333966 RepID=UPI001687EA08|nr:hypothetical protein [Saccharopolyspora pogona]
MSYPPQDPYGAQSGPYGGQSGQYPSESYQSGQYPPQNGSDDFWRHVAGNQPPMPPKKSRTGLIVALAGAGAVVVIGIVVTIILVVVNSNGGSNTSHNAGSTTSSSPTGTGSTSTSTSTSSSSQFAAGNCIDLLSEKGGDMNAATCGSADSDYEIVDVQRGTDHSVCGDNYSNVTGSKTYCIVLDVKAGDCLTGFNDSVDVLPLKIDCSTAEDQVTEVANGTDPKTACAQGEGYYVFADRTVCFGDVQGA